MSEREVIMTVKQDENAPIAVEVVAESIVAISDGIKKLRNTSLKDDALYLLIQHAAPGLKNGRYAGRKPNIGEIKAVFAGIEALRRTYLKTAK